VFWPITETEPFYEITVGRPGRIRGSSKSAEATSHDDSLELKLIRGAFEEGFPGPEKITNFSAQRLIVFETKGEIAFTRYLYGGADLDGYLDFTERVNVSADGGRCESVRDSIDIVLFGKRARVTSVPRQTHSSLPIISITISGGPLTDSDEHILWLVLSFVAGGRVQILATEFFDRHAVRVAIQYHGSVEYGPIKSPPFDLRFASPEYDRHAWAVLANGFARAIRDGYPMAIALHHLHEANTAYYQVEIKNLLFCIHTLFEAWTDLTGNRAIVRPPSRFKLAAKTLQSTLDATFEFNHEACKSVAEAIRFANDRGGSTLQYLFFSALGINVSETDRRALGRRNRLFHRGYLRCDPSNEAELQVFVDDARSLRTLCHHALLKLSGYVGPFIDYLTYEIRQCESVPAATESGRS
jgi:hypothetical protein